MTIRIPLSARVGAVAFAVALACMGAPTPPTEGKACDRLGRTVAHGGQVLTCRQGPRADEWTWQR